jgi:S1-C subfamily serine protease
MPFARHCLALSIRRPITAAILAVVTLLEIHIPASGAQQLDPSVLNKVKAATVYFQVTLSDNRVVQGSGFFADEPGLIITNAHVLQMLDPESRKPAKIEVTVNSGTEKSRTLAAKVVGVDRGSDLALVRVEDRDPPPALSFGTTQGLSETQSLLVFGFPFGKQLGKEITVSKSSVSSLRKTGASITSIQLDGGLNPGNSGGPVVDSAGNVIGVAVSGVRGTTIGNAIPAEAVKRFLNGRIVGSASEVPYTDGNRMMMELTFDLIDPLGRLKNVEFQIWAGNPGPARPSAAKEPPPQPGDSGKKRYRMPYEKKPSVTLAVPLPKLGEKQVFWIQPIITDGGDETRWVAATAVPAKPPLDRRSVSLKYKPPVGGKQSAEIVSNGDFRVRTSDGDQDAVGINLSTAFTETFAEESPKDIPARLTYDRFGLTIRVNNKPIERDAELRKMQTDIRFAAADLKIDKDGSIADSKADLRRVPKTSRAMISDLSDQILQSLKVLSIPLPEKKIEVQDTWKAQRTFQIGSAIISVPVQADVTYKYMGVQKRDGREGALIRLNGRVKGRKGDGLDVSGSAKGSAFISLETGQVISADATIKADMDLTFSRKQAKAVATLAVLMKRPGPAAAAGK